MADKKAEAAKRLKERAAASKKRFKLPEGETTFRLLPNAISPDKREYAEYGMHQQVGPKKAYIRCGKNSQGEGECWLCDTMIPKLEKSEKSSKRKYAEVLARKDSFAIQIAVKGDDDNWSGPFLWEMPNSLAMSLLGMLAKRDISNPEKGYDLTISRVGTGFTDTKYGAIERDESKSEAPENVIKRLKSFKDILKRYDEDAMKAAYYGQEQEDEPEEEEEDEPKSKKKPAEEEEEEPEETPKKKKKPAEDEEPEEEPEEDEPKPKKKKPVEEEEEEPEEDAKPAKKKKPAEDEEEELEKLEEEFSEEEVPDLEEEETPKKKKKPAEEEEEEPEEDEKPAKKKKKPADEEPEEEDEPKAKKKKKPAEDEEED
jgi:hypothetical protein